MPLGERLRLLRYGLTPLVIFLSMTGLFLTGITNLTELSAVGALVSTIAAWWRGRLSWPMLEEVIRQTLGISAMFLWIILAALGFGAVFDGLGAGRALARVFVEGWNLGPWEVLIMMQVSYLIMGMFLDDTAMLVIVAPLYVPLVDRARVRPDLVRRALHHHLPDRLHHPAVRLQPVPDAGAGAARDHAAPTSTARSSPSCGIMLVALAIITAFPQIALWLPQQVSLR